MGQEGIKSEKKDQTACFGNTGQLAHLNTIPLNRVGYPSDGRRSSAAICTLGLAAFVNKNNSL